MACSDERIGRTLPIGESMFETVTKVKTIMGKFGFPWFIAGGWAIDLFLNAETRTHDDVEIGIYRKNQMQLYRYFEKNRKYYIDNRNYTGKRVKHEWNKEYLRLPIHELYIEHDGLEIEILLNEKDDGNWVYRRNIEITLDERKVVLLSPHGIPYLCPEVVSLYKTKAMRSKDIDDITAALAKMSESQKGWLIASIKDEMVKERIRNLAIASSTT